MIDMIDLIRRIIDNGHGYVVYDADGKPTGNVYFDVAKLAALRRADPSEAGRRRGRRGRRRG